MNKYRIEKRIFGKVRKVLETNDLEEAKRYYKEIDCYYHKSHCRNSVTLLYIDGELLKFKEAEKVVYTSEERRQMNEYLKGEYKSYGYYKGN